MLKIGLIDISLLFIPFQVKKVDDPATVFNRLVKWVDDKAKENEKK